MKGIHGSALPSADGGSAGVEATASEYGDLERAGFVVEGNNASSPNEAGRKQSTYVFRGSGTSVALREIAYPPTVSIPRELAHDIRLSVKQGVSAADLSGLTPGLVTEDGLLDARANNYLVAIDVEASGASPLTPAAALVPGLDSIRQSFGIGLTPDETSKHSYHLQDVRNRTLIERYDSDAPANELRGDVGLQVRKGEDKVGLQGGDLVEPRIDEG